MVKPVNKHVLVEIVKKDVYEARKSGILVSTETSERGPVLVVVAVAEDVSLPLEAGDRIFTWDQRLLYFYDGEKQLALIKEDSIAGVTSAE